MMAARVLPPPARYSRRGGAGDVNARVWLALAGLGCRIVGRGVGDGPARVEEIRSTAASWVHFWAGHLDVDALAWDVSEHLAGPSWLSDS
jgi:hypothetical protein